MSSAGRRTFGYAPSASEIEAIARRTLQRLPPLFAERLTDVALLVEEFADRDTLSELGIDDPFELSGVYEGLPLTEKGAADSGGLPDRIRLFRRPILDEWATHEYSLEHLVRHIVIHEAGHHFGFSDADMHALEAQVEDDPRP